MRIPTIDELLAAAPSVPVLLGVSITLAALATTWAITRHRHQRQTLSPDELHKRKNNRLMTLFVLMATGISVEGMWVVLSGEQVAMPIALTVVVVGLYEVGMYLFGSIARRAIRQQRAAWPYVLVVWVLAILGGRIASLPAEYQDAEQLLRFAAAIAAAIAWSTVIGIEWAEARETAAAENGKSAATTRTAWRWTPKRIAIRLGLLHAGDTDLAGLSHQQQVHRLIRAAERVADDASGSAPKGRRSSAMAEWIQQRRQRRLRTLIYASNPGLIDEARSRIAQANRTVYELTTATANPAAEPTSGVDTSGGQQVGSEVDTTGGHHLDSEVDSFSDGTGLDVRTRQLDTRWTPQVDSDRTAEWTPQVDSVHSARVSGGHHGWTPSGHRSPGHASSRRASATKAQIRQLLTEQPDLTQAAIAERVGISSKSVQRHLKELNGFARGAA